MVEKVKDGTRIEIGTWTWTGSAEIEDERRNRYRDGHTATVDTNDEGIRSIFTQAEPWEKAIYNKIIDGF
ncbi:hypothetical protein EVAR_40243_1 [Eumeta japonica]|uniref:Uncharacterized protein n=1 Tax=Eumeta variegata TaxID=151549 RepID=A0A4C1XBW4_EUMVA|nr:hypothetical protein EVAR_40243_1 [Eumeta japonica]